MARILICVWPLRSHFAPLVPVARALQARGHTVAFYSGRAACAMLVAEGFQCFPFAAVDDDWVERSFLKEPAAISWKDALRFRRFMIAWLVETVPDQVRDLEPVVREWRPDVVVSETSLWGPMLVLAERLQVPVAVFSTVIACLLPGPEVPPYGLGLPPPRTFRARLLAGIIERVRGVVAGKLIRAANAVRRSYALAPLRRTTVTEHIGRMPLYLVPTVREFDYDRRDLPPSVHYVGPCVWNRAQHDSRPAWLDAVAAAGPLVHITEGSMNSQEPRLMQAGAAGLGGLPLQVVMTCGDHRDPAALGLGPLAANVRIERYLAHEYLLPLTAVVVTTGGAGTVSAALMAGVPLIVVPTATDQPENARRVQWSGAGLYLPWSRCTPDGLRAAVERVLAEPSFKANAERLGALLRAADGPGRAAALIEDLAAAGGAPS